MVMPNQWWWPANGGGQSIVVPSQWYELMVVPSQWRCPANGGGLSVVVASQWWCSPSGGSGKLRVSGREASHDKCMQKKADF